MKKQGFPWIKGLGFGTYHREVPGSFGDGRDGVGEQAHTSLLSMSMRCYTKMDAAPTAELSPKVGGTQSDGLSCVSL